MAIQHMSFLGGSVVKNLPAMQEMQEMQVQSLVQEDPQKKSIAACSSILAWRIPEDSAQRSLAGYNPSGHTESDKTEATQHTCTFVTAVESLGQHGMYY